jgi:uncharacterized protein (TIGR02145 family)
MTWESPFTSWDDTIQQGIGESDFNRIEGDTFDIFNQNLIYDYDGTAYRTLKIGSQTWTIDNWRSSKYSNGVAIPKNSFFDSEYPGYEDYAGIYRYGYYYTWATISPDNINNLAPDGWRVPTIADYKALIDFLAVGGYGYEYFTGGDWDTGNRLAKVMASQQDWGWSTNAGAPGDKAYLNNFSQFNFSPAGYYNFLTSTPEEFYISGYLWTVDTSPIDVSARAININYNLPGVYNVTRSKGNLFSVRFILDS